VKAFFSFMIRWVIPLLGLIALSLIIWFVGPLLDVLVPEGRRWALIVLLFAAWLAYRVFRILQARRQAAEVMRSLAAQNPGRPQQRRHRRRTHQPAPAHGRSPGPAEKSQARRG